MLEWKLFKRNQVYAKGFPATMVTKSHLVSSSLALSITGLWAQQPKQGCPDSPLGRHFLQLFEEYSEALPGQPQDMVSPPCPGSASEPPPSRTCLEHLLCEAFRGHPKQMPDPPQLTPFNTKEQWRLSKLLPSHCASHPLSKGAPATLCSLFRAIYISILFIQCIL